MPCESVAVVSVSRVTEAVPSNAGCTLAGTVVAVAEKTRNVLAQYSAKIPPMATGAVALQFPWHLFQR